MADRPIVSIITPTYNHEDYISECIESVLSQTYDQWEQIIIDDGSTDGTTRVVEGYDDERILFSRQENKGIWRLSEIYNDALRRSRGKYIAILEGDDFWPDYKLERQIGALDDSRAAISWGIGALTDRMGNITSYRPVDIRPFLGISRHGMVRDLLFDNPITACTVICRKSALEAIGGFRQPEYVPYLDRPTWLELGLKGDFLVMDEVLGYYRIHERQVTARMRLSMFKAGKHTAEFFFGLPEDARAAIAGKGHDPAGLDSKLAESFYYFGRASLIEGDWSAAEKSFFKAFSMCGPKTRVKAAAGLLCGLCHHDLEPLAKVLGSPSIDG